MVLSQNKNLFLFLFDLYNTNHQPVNFKTYTCRHDRNMLKLALHTMHTHTVHWFCHENAMFSLHNGL